MGSLLDHVWPSDRTLKYSTVHPNDTDDKGATEFSEDHLAVENDFYVTREPRRLFSLHGILTATLAVSCLIQSILLFPPSDSRASPFPQCGSALFLRSGNYPRLISSRAVEFHKTTFERQRDWEFSPSALELWDAVIPHSGIVAVKNPEKYGFGAALETSAPQSMAYGLTFTHQYHCLMIHESLIGVATREPAAMEAVYAANTSVTLQQGRLNHLLHCVDYLRQHVQCRADTTPEWGVDIDPGVLDGYGVPRECRDWNEVSAWMENNLPPEPKFHRPQMFP